MYEYKWVRIQAYSGLDEYDLNKHSLDGWRVVPGTLTRGGSSMLMERQISEQPLERKPQPERIK